MQADRQTQRKSAGMQADSVSSSHGGRLTIRKEGRQTERQRDRQREGRQTGR